jgi:hypothetical protein
MFWFICAPFLAAWVFVCYCVVPKYVGVLIIFVMYALLIVGSSPCLCSSVYRSMYVDLPLHTCLLLLRVLMKVNRTKISVKQFYCVEQRQTKTNEQLQTVRIVSFRYFLCWPIIVPDAVAAQCKMFSFAATEPQLTSK